MAPNRHLAAIMFTDIVGYTAMMQEDEVAAIQVRHRHRAIFKKEHERCNGVIVQYFGDGTLSTFASAVEAVDCAIKMQREFQTGTIVPLRIGIHLGDIVFDDIDVYGDGINLASRIETLGVSGSVLISENVQDAIQSHASLHTKSLGFFEFKNVKNPVEVYSITNDGIFVPRSSDLKGKLKEKRKSIAVLPFVNMSSDPDNEYFSDGVTEEILNGLAKVEGLRVIARTSSFSFKDKNMDVRQIGQELGVDHILEGSVRKAGDRARITCQLVSTADGSHFFSETYDRTLEDIFAVQDEIAQKITYRLREHMGQNLYQKQLVKQPTLNIEAYETYLKGLYYYNQWGHNMEKAIPLFEKAIEIQHDFALPHAQLGLCYLFQALSRHITMKEAYAKALIHMKWTRKLNAKLPEVYMSTYIFELFFKWNWQAALDTVRKGLELFPNYPSFYHALSGLYQISGDLPKILEAQKRGYELDPLSIEMNMYMGIANLCNYFFDDAIIYFNNILEIVPNYRGAFEYKGWALAWQQKYKEALEIFYHLEPENGYRLHRSTCLGWVYFKQGEFDKAQECLLNIKKMEENSTAGIHFTIDLTLLYTCFGNFEMAFHYLEKALKHKVGNSLMCRSDLFLAPLRSDSRFAKIEAILGNVPTINL